MNKEKERLIEARLKWRLDNREKAERWRGFFSQWIVWTAFGGGFALASVPWNPALAVSLTVTMWCSLIGGTIAFDIYEESIGMPKRWRANTVRGLFT